MRQHAPTDARDLQRRLPDRVMTALRRYRHGGRRVRTARRAVAVLLLIAAGVIASSEQPAAVDGDAVVLAARDMDVGTTVGRSDLRTTTVRSPPDGAITAAQSLVGRVLAAPVRRGEIFTDVRLLDASGPRAGAGRIAVPVRIDDSGAVDLLRPGTHVGLIAAPSGDAVGPRVLTDDAVVMSVVGPAEGPLPGVHHDRVIVVAVATASADAVAAASLTGAIAIRFR